MYVPPMFEVSDRERLFDFVEQYGFATFISSGDPPFVSHLPLMLDRSTGTLQGHFARANPHGTLLDGRGATAVFHGPHAYVSPAWYSGDKPAVPTWNYAVVHAQGIPQIRNDEAFMRSLLERTVAKYEKARPAPWNYALPDDYMAAMLKQIVGFEMPLSSIRGKFKLSQNRSKADRDGVLQGLDQEGGAELAELLRRSLHPL